MAKQNKQKSKTENKKVQEKEEVVTETLEQEDSSSSEDQAKAGNELEQQLGEAKDKYLRLYSEFENYRRRTSKERIELISSAGKDVIEALLPVVDDFERAIKAAGEEDEGITLIYNKFKKILIDKGLKDMGTQAGDDFNDEYHEAVTQIPAPDKSLEGKIVDVIEPGYFMGEKVLRFAKVVVGSKG